jgi:cobalt-zinc-cadmium efflux system membrane fusion protein
MSVEAIDALARTRTVNSISQVVSSIQGTVIERKVTQGQVVQPADSIYLVADLSTLWVVADIPEQRAGKVRAGEMVEADVVALPGRRIKGRLSFVGVTVDPETRTVRARMDVANPDMDLKPAMLATVLIRSDPQRMQVIPAAAVVREGNRDHVFVQIAPSRYRLRLVSLGDESDGRRVVLGGLLDGEQVVSEGAFHLNNERRQRATQGGGSIKTEAGNG